jgi:hypothetical protein
MKDVNTIVEEIEKNYKKIVDNIEEESNCVYRFLQEEFKKPDACNNHLFQFVYRNYYEFRSARVTKDFIQEYFKIMQEYRQGKQFDYHCILDRLYNIQNKLQFSFATKMHHTIDNTFPIYDSKVKEMLNINIEGNEDIKHRIDDAMKKMKELKKLYEEIETKDLLHKTMNYFNKKHNLDGLSYTKKLDYIFWSAGKLKGK